MNLTYTEIPVCNMISAVGGTEFGIFRQKIHHNPGYLLRPHRHTGYSITLLLSGRMTKLIDFERYELKAPAVMSMAPEQVHQYTHLEDCEMICLSFSHEFLLPEMQGWVACWECMFGHVVMDLDEASLRQLTTYSELMIQEFNSNHPQREAVIRNLLNAFIICFARLKGKSATVMRIDTFQNKLVQQFKTMVDVNYKKKTQVTQYAELLAVTPGHLNDVIKTTTGSTAKQIIDSKRIMEAKRLLYWGNHTIKEIAWQLSFEDDAYFNRFFKKHAGITPYLFQRSTREKYNSILV